MKRWNYIACLSAAVAAVMIGGQRTQAQTLIWDASGSAGSGTPVDGAGSWDLSNTNWTNGTTNVVWPNSSASPTTPVVSAQFGNLTGGSGQINPTLNEISLAAPIEVQNLTFGTTSDNNSSYFIDDGGSGSLTVDGNITKSTSNGQLQFLLFGSSLTLSSGNHTIAINDTPTNVPELTMNCQITGAGSITLDNSQFSSGSYGTLIFGQDNSYTGGTTVTNGYLGIATGNGLGSGAVTISNAGTLAVGGPGLSNIGSMTINNTITITRNTYTGGTNGDFGKNPDAFVSGNTGNASAMVTLPNLIIDSTDARLAADTSTLVLPNPLTAAADVNGTAVADFDGDFAGFVDLNGDNSAFGAAGNAIAVTGGVELNVSTIQNLGGSGSKLILNGGFIHITRDLLANDPSFGTNFGAGTTHVINTTAVGTGVDVDQGETFTVNGLSGGGVGMRGGGTLNYEGTNTFTGTPYFDGVGPGQTDTTATGVVNYTAGSTTNQPGFRVRSATVNITGTANVGGSFTSIGADSTGSNGTPDYATVNITGNGVLSESTGDDFNISDNANTQGTINIRDNGQLITGGITWLGKNNGSVGTINQYGGSITINRNGNFGFILADGRGNKNPTGYYNLYGGTFTSAGEVYVGEGGNNAVGYWTQTGGTANINNWFVVGREGAVGHVVISGGTLNHSGGNMSLGDSTNGGVTDTITVSGNAVINDNSGDFYVGNNGANAEMDQSGTSSIVDSSGQFWIGNGSPGNGLVNISDTASITVNNWFAIGRAGGAGTLNINGGAVVTQQTSNWFTIGSGGTGTVNVNGGTLNVLQAYIGETGGTSGTLNINSGSVNLTNNSIFANASTVAGTLNLNGGTLTAFGFQAQNGGGSGKATFDFNGGVLKASTNNTTAFIGAKVTSVVSAGGAIINTNGFTDRINSVLTHDSTLSGADGGLTKQGAGTLTLGATNTYTGPTTISGGTLQYLDASENLASLSIANGAALDLSGAGTVTIASGLSGFLSALQTGYASGAWTGTSATAPVITSAFASTHLGTGIGYSTSDSALNLRLTWLGDVDLSGVVTASDITDMTPMSSGATWANGDFNYDGEVNADDYALAQLGIAESAGKNITAVAPEPAMVLALPMLIGLMPRRSRRR